MESETIRSRSPKKATHPLHGADLATLRGAFRDGGGPASALRYASLYAAALLRWPSTTFERRVIEPRLPPLAVSEPPLFILGHWRSGTTHLYNVMAAGGWGYVDPIAAGLPHDVLGLAALLRPLLEHSLPESRWIDRIPVTPTSPQEDEIAIANMTPLSFYHGLYFPSRFDELIERGLFFDGCDEAQIAAWSDCFLRFLRKIAHRSGQRLLIKNPVYTARPALIRKLLPDARFIHIHRSPYEVFVSMRNFYARLLPVMALQPVPPDLDIDATILRVYRRMMERFDAEAGDWSPPTMIEIAYDRLDREAMTVLEEIYQYLELPAFDGAAPRFRHYLDSVHGYRKNAFEIDTASACKVEAECGPWLERWGYRRPAAA